MIIFFISFTLTSIFWEDFDLNFVYEVVRGEGAILCHSLYFMYAWEFIKRRENLSIAVGTSIPLEM